MSQKLTRRAKEELRDALTKRLRVALEDGPRPTSVRDLAKKMEGRENPPRGATYGGLRQYFEGKILNPRAELLREVASELGVRVDWLVRGDGKMTKAEEELDHVKEAEPQDNARSPEDKALYEDIARGFGEGAEELWIQVDLRLTLIETWFRIATSGLLPTQAPTYSPILDNLSIGGISLAGQRALTAGYYLGRALRSPFKELKFKPEDLSEEDFHEYIVAACIAIRRLASAYSKRVGGPIPPPTTAPLRRRRRTEDNPNPPAARGKPKTNAKNAPRSPRKKED